MFTWKRLFVVVITVISAALLTACYEKAASPASCGFVAGDGQEGRDANLRQIIYPGQVVSNTENTKTFYVPCNSRNYIVTDGTKLNASDKKVGDRFEPIEATTSTGVRVRITLRAFWTLNQDPDALEAFFNVCYKYTCWSETDQGGTANFSSDGWNGMLSENMDPTLESTVKDIVYTMDDSIWRDQNPAKRMDLADKMSPLLGPKMLANMGYPVDLFCGSGNSKWSSPDKVGRKGEFICTEVRVEVQTIERSPVQANDTTEGAKQLNQERLSAAKELYGDEEAGRTLATLDMIQACKDTGTPCVINVGGTAGGPAIPVPMSAPVSGPAPTPTTNPK